MCVCMCVCICMYVCMCVCMSACMYVWVCVSGCMYVRMTVCMYVCMYVSLSVCLTVCLYACMYGWMDVRRPQVSVINPPADLRSAVLNPKDCATDPNRHPKSMGCIYDCNVSWISYLIRYLITGRPQIGTPNQWVSIRVSILVGLVT